MVAVNSNGGGGGGGVVSSSSSSSNNSAQGFLSQTQHYVPKILYTDITK